MPRKCKERSRRHYSRDLKLAVIHQTYILGYKSTRIAVELDIPLRVVQRIRQNWKELRDVCKERSRIGRSPLISPGSCKVCCSSRPLILNRSWQLPAYVCPNWTFSGHLLGWDTRGIILCSWSQSLTINNLAHLEKTRYRKQAGEPSSFQSIFSLISMPHSFQRLLQNAQSLHVPNICLELAKSL